MAITDNAKKILEIGINALNDKKAEDIKCIDITEISSIADVMVIASGNNINQLQAMADSVEESLGRAGYQFLSYEGYDKANWVLLDYNDVIFHIFDKDSREFYNLERLYRDGNSL